MPVLFAAGRALQAVQIRLFIDGRKNNANRELDGCRMQRAVLLGSLTLIIIIQKVNIKIQNHFQ
jgi:hypothetical protein